MRNCRKIGLLLIAASTPMALLAQEAEDPALTRIKALKAQYELETQAFLASKARSDAETAAATAKLGPLASYQTAGTIEVGANSGKLEAALLASEATRVAAAQIALDMCSLLRKEPAQSACGDKGVGPAKLLIFTDAEKPTFDALDAFNAQLFSIRAQLERAAALEPAPAGPRGVNVVSASLPMFSTLLSTAGNLLRSDYKLSGIEISPSDSLLVKSFVQQARIAKIRSVLSAPSVYGGRIDFKSNPAFKDLEAVETLRNSVAAKADALRELAGTKPKNKAEIDKVVAEMDKAVARFDVFSQKLGTPDDKGNVPLAAVARQAVVAGTMTDDTYLLLLKSDLAGGSAYSKKNFWTFLGDMPFSVSGGSLVSYTLLNGRSGDVVYAGVLGQTEPFSKLHAATQRFVRTSPAQD